MLKEKIIISGQEYTLKESNRVLLKFESETGKSAFSPLQTMEDQMKLFWANISVNNPSMKQTFDEFADELEKDENDEVFSLYTLYKERANEEADKWSQENDPNYEKKKTAMVQMMNQFALQNSTKS